MKLAVVTMARDAEVWLRQTLPVWEQISDGIIALDDHSTDNTRQMLREAGALIVESPQEEPAWGREAAPRAALFDAFHKSDYDFGLWLDADMIPARDPRPLLHEAITGVSFALYDLWSPSHYREDGYWFGHRYPRTWLIRRPVPRFQADWNERWMHCGHFPKNLVGGRIVRAPLDYSLLHYAYSSPELRARKLAAYRGVSAALDDHERAHAESIGDDAPCLKPLPFAPVWPLEFSSEPVLV